MTSEQAVSKLIGLEKKNQNTVANISDGNNDNETSSSSPDYIDYVRRRNKHIKNQTNTMVNDTESSVLATFEFLNNQNDHESMSMLENIDVEDEDVIDQPLSDGSGGTMNNDETEEVLNEFDMILNNRVDNQRENLYDLEKKRSDWNCPNGN